MSDSYSDYSDSYTESAGTDSSKSSKQRQAPAFTFSDIPAEVSFSLGEYCTIVLKPGKKQYVVEVATNYPRETANKVQLTFGEHGCSVTQAQNAVRSTISQPIPMDISSPRTNQHSQQGTASLSTSAPLATQAQTDAPPSEPVRLNPRDFYRRPRG